MKVRKSQPHPIGAFAVLHQPVLEEEDRGQDAERERQNDDLDRLALPQALPQGGVQPPHDRSRQPPPVFGRFAACHRLRRESIGAAARNRDRRSRMPSQAGRFRAQPAAGSASGWSGAKTARGHDPEERHFAETRRTGGQNLAQALVLLVAEAHADVALDQLDAVEDAAAHIARSLERIEPVARQQDRLLAGFEALAQVGLFSLAQHAAADRRDRHQGRVELDEGVAGLGLAWRDQRLGVAGLAERPR